MIVPPVRGDLKVMSILLPGRQPPSCGADDAPPRARAVLSESTGASSTRSSSDMPPGTVTLRSRSASSCRRRSDRVTTPHRSGATGCRSRRPDGDKTRCALLGVVENMTHLVRTGESSSVRAADRRLRTRSESPCSAGAFRPEGRDYCDRGVSIVHCRAGWRSRARSLPSPGPSTPFRASTPGHRQATSARLRLGLLDVALVGGLLRQRGRRTFAQPHEACIQEVGDPWALRSWSRTWSHAGRNERYESPAEIQRPMHYGSDDSRRPRPPFPPCFGSCAAASSVTGPDNAAISSFVITRLICRWRGRSGPVAETDPFRSFASHGEDRRRPQRQR